MKDNSTLPEAIRKRLEKDAFWYCKHDTEPRRHYLEGAEAEATRSLILIEALEAWQTFDSRIHNGVDAARLHLQAKKALTEYNNQAQ